MRIIRNKNGYVIRVTNAEMDLLHYIHDEGMQGVAEQHADDCTGLGSAAKRLLTQVYNGSRSWMQVNEDRRA